MGFAHPWLLLLLVIPLVLLVWVWRLRCPNVVLPFDHGDRNPHPLPDFALKLAESLPALLLAVAILLLAGPRRFGTPQTKRELTNIEFCVDISGSMTAPFGQGSRYDASMAAIDEFLDYRQGDAFGLTFFGNSVLHWTPLTRDTSAIRCAPPFMRPENAPPWFGGTEIGRALTACSKLLGYRPEGDRMIILVTDGWSSDLGGSRGEEIGRNLAADNIILYVIQVSGSQPPSEITTLTSLTGGEVFAPGDPASLEAVFAHIDRMQKTKLKKVRAEFRDDFVPYSLVGLGLAGLSLLSLWGLRSTPW